MREMVVTGLVVLAEGLKLKSKAIKNKENAERRLIDIQYPKAG